MFASKAVKYCKPYSSRKFVPKTVKKCPREFECNRIAQEYAKFYEKPTFKSEIFHSNLDKCLIDATIYTPIVLTGALVFTDVFVMDLHLDPNLFTASAAFLGFSYVVIGTAAFCFKGAVCGIESCYAMFRTFGEKRLLN
jgi:hypothetical protein